VNRYINNRFYYYNSASFNLFLILELETGKIESFGESTSADAPSLLPADGNQLAKMKSPDEGLEPSTTGLKVLRSTKLS
jgi:hypothetical protein